MLGKVFLIMRLLNVSFVFFKCFVGLFLVFIFLVHMEFILE